MASRAGGRVIRGTTAVSRGKAAASTVGAVEDGAVAPSPGRCDRVAICATGGRPSSLRPVEAVSAKGSGLAALAFCLHGGRPSVRESGRDGGKVIAIATASGQQSQSLRVGVRPSQVPEDVPAIVGPTTAIGHAVVEGRARGQSRPRLAA